MRAEMVLGFSDMSKHLNFLPSEHNYYTTNYIDVREMEGMRRGGNYAIKAQGKPG